MLRLPEGPNADQPASFTPLQRQFIQGAMAVDTANRILSIGRGQGKSAIMAGLARDGLVGVWAQRRFREIIAAAQTRDQGRGIWDFAANFAAALPLNLKRRLRGIENWICATAASDEGLAEPPAFCARSPGSVRSPARC